MRENSSNLGAPEVTIQGQDTKRPEVAFYYPGWIWGAPSFIKNLLLFFDGVALLVPTYMKRRVETVDPELSQPLLDQGLLHILEPEKAVDKSATETLAKAMVEILDSGQLDSLVRDRTAFHELSYSRLGGYGDRSLADFIIEQLKKRRLARGTEDGVSIPLHPIVHRLVLVLQSQILRNRGKSFGLELHPATERTGMIHVLSQVFSGSSSASSGHVVASDLMTVGVDLTKVPLDEILSFRSEHNKLLRKYARDVRKFVTDLSNVRREDRVTLQEDRREELIDIASDLKENSVKAWKGPASFALGVSGFVWSIAIGNALGAILRESSILLGRDGSKKEVITPYSYIFRAKDRFSR